MFLGAEALNAKPSSSASCFGPTVVGLQARLLLRMGFTCLNQIAETGGMPIIDDADPDTAISLTFEEFTDAVRQLESVGYPVEVTAEQSVAYRLARSIDARWRCGADRGAGAASRYRRAGRATRSPATPGPTTPRSSGAPGRGSAGQRRRTDVAESGTSHRPIASSHPVTAARKTRCATPNTTECCVAPATRNATAAEPVNTTDSRCSDP